MFLNMTAETCTGTGLTLTLTGAVAGKIAFGASGNAEDGQLVSCVVHDAGGVTKVAGIYTFNKAANTFNRNDTWNYNGTVVDKTPSANIALSGGTHTISCDTSYSVANNGKRFTLSPLGGNHDSMPDNWIQLDDNSRQANSNYTIFCPLYFSTSWTVNSLLLKVVSSDPTTAVQAGLVHCGDDGVPAEIIEILTIDVTATGDIFTSLSREYTFPPGRYFTVFAQSDQNAGFWSIPNLTHAGRSGSYVFRGGNNSALGKSNGMVDGVIVTPLIAPNGSVDPLDNIMVMPRFVE